MTSDDTSPRGRSPWGPAEVVAVAFFAISVGAWLLASPLVIQALVVLTQPKPGDEGIGLVLVAIATLYIGVPMFLVSLLLALAAGRLPIGFRVASVLPGLAAVLAAMVMWGFPFRL